MSKLINDLRILESVGIDVEMLGEIINIKGSLIAIVGDNLGNHQLGDFLDNFSKSEYLCKFFLFYKSNLNKSDINIKELRNPENYNSCIQHLEENTNKDSFYGIKRNSPSNNLKYFNICTPGLAPCLAHDILKVL